MTTQQPGIRRIETRNADAYAELAELRQKLSPDGNIVSEASRQRTMAVFGEPLSPQQVVERICRDVRQQGLPAVLDYLAKLDGAKLTAETLRVPAEELAEAHAAAAPAFLATLRTIRGNILRFQEAILHRDVTVGLEGGGKLMQRYVPLERVGICVPGGAASYPSTVLMTAVPAQAAGVKELVVIAPPTKFGAYNPVLLATCHELGIREVYRMGGAQAIAALAYGLADVPSAGKHLPRVDKIVGPGNLFVALAKKFVFGDVDIDSIAGPSEIVVIGDDNTSAEFVAADMLAQAEHAPGAAILITTSKRLWEQVAEAVNRQIATLERGDLARQSLEDFGALVLARDEEEVVQLTEQIAPEHLHIACDDAERWLPHLKRAGAVFLGPYSPVAAGDYAAGPSHVLPTGGTARFAHGLCANDFLRSHSVIALTADDLKRLGPDIEVMAHQEGLTAHAESVAVRLR